MSWLSKLEHEAQDFLTNHTSLLEAANNIIKGLLEVAPIPKAESDAIREVIGGIEQVVSNGKAIAAQASTAVEGVEGEVVALTTEPVVKTLEGTAAVAGVSSAANLIPTLISQAATGGLNTSTIAADVEEAVEDAANAFGKGLIPPKPPTGN